MNSVQGRSATLRRQPRGPRARASATALVAVAVLLGTVGCGERLGSPPNTTTGASSSPATTIGEPASEPSSSAASSSAPSSSSAPPAPPKSSAQGAPTVPPQASPKPVGFPSQSDTGYAHTGVQLQRVSCERDEYLIDKDGTVVEGKLIPCSVRVAANDVKIIRSKIEATGMWGIYKLDANRSLTVSDVEIAGSDACEYGLGFTSFTATRLDIHGCSDGVHTEEGSTLQDSWVHNLSYGPGDHNDGVQLTGSSNVTIKHNRIENPRNQTSAILVGGEFGAPSNILIEGNYLNGGNYTVYLDPKGSNRAIRNNTFTKNFVYGPARIEGQIDWTGNTFEDGSAVTY